MKPRAFTLVELLVVISVIAVLMGILMPVLSKARAAGQNARCKGNLKGYALAVSMYTTDNDGRFQEPWFAYFSQRGPYPSETGIGNQYIHLRWCNGDLYLREHPEIAGPFYRYLSDARGFICPRFKVLTRFGQAQDIFYQANRDAVRHYKPWYNYTMNAYLGPHDGELSGIRVSTIQEVRHPATTFSFAEESSFADNDYNRTGLNNTFMVPGTKDMVNRWLGQAGYNVWAVTPGPLSGGNVGVFWNVIGGFHHAPSGDVLGGRGNCAFLDGHVAAHPRSETFPLAWPRGKVSGPIP